MSFISYAQNFEDVMLWRALRHVEKGTYVDIGAQDPVVDSVSKAFYTHGWRGLHIEPVPYYADRLRQDRPDEIVLQAALGEAEGTLTLNVFSGTGLSTAVDAHAHRHNEAGFTAQQVVVPMLTVTSALQMLAGRDVHWLKIDVEGYEKQVLRGWDSTGVRPWILVIEATIPGSSKTDYSDWEPLVLGAGYQFVYFDGLNRFFVANEHPELVASFAAPPNVFDDFQMSGEGSWGLFRAVEARRQAEHEAVHARLTAEIEVMRTIFADSQQEFDSELAKLQVQTDIATRELAQSQQAIQLKRDALKKRLDEMQDALARRDEENEVLKRRVIETQAQTHEWWSVADRLSKEVVALHASRSWRLTQPLRNVVIRAQRARRWPRRSLQIAKAQARTVVRFAVVGVLRTVLARPQARARVSRLLERYPGLKQAVRRIAGRAGLIQGMPSAVSPTVVMPIDGMQSGDVARRAMRVYVQLKNIQNGKS